jgi:hypothetical protein
MPKLRESILADIHAKHIRPRARWQYILLHTGLYMSWIITIILWSFACAFMILEFSLPERAYLHWMESQNNLGWFLALPYLWWIGLILALTTGYFIFSKTWRSYRFHAGAIVLVLIIGSIVGGEILYITRMAHWSDRQMQRFEPRYRDMRQNFARMMPRPADGVLPVRVSSIVGDVFYGKTPEGQSWEVNLQCSSDECRERKEKTIIGRPVIFEWSISEPGKFSAIDLLLLPKGVLKNKGKRKPPTTTESLWDNASLEKAE